MTFIIDPAAFYGMHHDINGGIEYRNNSGNKQKADTKALIYEHILNPYLTKNTIYLDIRNENGYSYNYYDNYVGAIASPDKDKELQIGETNLVLNTKKYYTDNWPIHIVEGLYHHAITFSKINLSLSEYYITFAKKK